MNSQILSKEGTEVKISFEVSPEKFEEGMKYSYNKNKNKISVPGFRKGKVPRKVIEAQFGPDMLYEDAVNWALNEEYPVAVGELNLDVVAMPQIDIKEIGKEIGVKVEATVTVKPEVKLGKYKGLEIKDFPTEVTEEEINAHFDKIRNDNARLVPVEDRPAQMGDTVTISYSEQLTELSLKVERATAMTSSLVQRHSSIHSRIRFADIQLAISLM